MKNILILSSEFPLLPGGIGNHALHLALYLEKEGKEVKVITDQRSEKIDNLTFEGGFAPRLGNRKVEGFEYLRMQKRETMNDYLTKTKTSSVVFNTPAVGKCHGWKLAEFLAMGKAIISTTISRELPVKLEDSKHILITNGLEEDIKAKIEMIISNDKLKNNLEQHSKQYYKDFLSPEKVIYNIFDKINWV